MKSGTSSLYRTLVQHPEICACVKKEPEFFSVHQTYGVEADSYEDLWPDYDFNVHRYCLEASTGYTKPAEEDVPARIRDYGLDPKFIYIVRNPIDRIVSHLNFHRINFGIEGEDFTDPHLIDQSRYGEQIEQYLRIFPERDRYCIIDFSALKESLERTAQKAFRFLDLEDTVAVTEKMHNVTSSKTNLEYKLERYGIKSKIRRLFPSTFRSHIRVAAKKFLKPAKRRISDSDRAHIRDELYADMRRFQEMTGFDVSRWNF